MTKLAAKKSSKAVKKKEPKPPKEPKTTGRMWLKIRTPDGALLGANLAEAPGELLWAIWMLKCFFNNVVPQNDDEPHVAKFRKAVGAFKVAAREYSVAQDALKEKDGE
jgi:hypothetical protein